MTDAEKMSQPPPPPYQDHGGMGTPAPPYQYPQGPPPPHPQGPPPPQYGAQPPMAQPQYASPYPVQQPGINQPPPPPPGTMIMGQPQTTVIVQQPLGMSGGYGPSPITMNCPYCSASVTSSTSKECGGMVWMVAGIICLVGLFFPLVWLGCCLIPFCIPSLYNTKHTCPNCQRLMGTHRQGGM